MGEVERDLSDTVTTCSGPLWDSHTGMEARNRFLAESINIYLHQGSVITGSFSVLFVQFFIGKINWKDNNGF